MTRADSSAGPSRVRDEPVLELPAADPRRYRLAGERGRGGLGQVLAARDRLLDREVAIKRALHRGADGHARFVREAMVASRLQHPGIVPVYDLGTLPDGEPYYAMKLVAGRSLQQAIDGAADGAARLALVPQVLAVAEAIAYAHAQGVVHRDLKPANVMLGDFGETFVVDWGLARDLRAPEAHEPASLADIARSGVTHTGAVLGTPGYMAPEQARGEPAGEAADVYALGGLLYAVVTGAPPCDGATTEARLHACLAGDVAPMTARAPGAPRELAAIAHRALAVRVGDRYPTAKQLADDLRRFLAGQLVAAHDYGALDHVRRFVRRHRAAVAVGGVLLAALVTTAVVSGRRIVHERDRAVRGRNELILARARAGLARDPTAAVAWLATLPADAAGWRDPDRGAPAIAADAVSRGVARHVVVVDRSVNDVVASGGVAVVAGRRGMHVVDVATGAERAFAALTNPGPVALAPGGGLVAAVEGAASLIVVDARTGEVRRLGEHAATVTALAWRGDGELVIGDVEGAVVAVPAGGGAPAALARHDGPVAALGVAGDGRVVSVGATGAVWATRADGSADAWARLEAPTGALAVHPSGAAAVGDGAAVVVLDGDGGRAVLGAHDAPVVALAFSDDGRWIASGSADRTARVWPSAGGAPRVLAGHDAELTRVVFAPGSATLATADQAGGVWLWPDTGGGARRHGHDRLIAGLAFTADGAGLVTADLGGELRVWPVTPGPRVQRADVPLFGLAALPDGRFAATAADGGVRVFGADTPPRVLGHHAAESYGLAVAGEVFVTGGRDGTVKVWGVDGALRAELRHGEPVWGVAVSADGRRVAAAGGPGARVSVWDWRDGGHVALAGHRAEATSVSFSPDGDRLASAGYDGAVRVWDLATGDARELRGHDGHAWAQFAAADVIVSVGADGAARVWTVSAGTSLALQGHTDEIRALAISPDGRVLATGSADTTIRLWDVRTGAHLRALRGHEAEVRDLAFSPDGRALASAGWDRVVRVWRLDTGASAPLRGQTGDIQRVAYSPDGAILASASRDGSVALWPGEPPSLPGEPAELRTALDAITTARVDGDGKVVTPAAGEQ